MRLDGQNAQGALRDDWKRLERFLVLGSVIYADNETWAGKVHPVEALQRYRAEMSIPARVPPAPEKKPRKPRSRR